MLISIIFYCIWKQVTDRKPGMLQSMGSQRIRHDRATELNWTENWWQASWEFMDFMIYNTLNLSRHWLSHDNLAKKV